MVSQTRISKWGSSLAVRIPKAVAAQWEVREGASVAIFNDGANVVLQKQKYDLDDMLSAMNHANMHPEIDMGSPVGDEAW